MHVHGDSEDTKGYVEKGKPLIYCPSVIQSLLKRYYVCLYTHILYVHIQMYFNVWQDISYIDLYFYFKFLANFKLTK